MGVQGSELSTGVAASDGRSMVPGAGSSTGADGCREAGKSE